MALIFKAAPAQKVGTKAASAAKRPKKPASPVPHAATAVGAVAQAPAPPGKQLAIRMYNVGFGDAFLVKIPQKKGELRILFDCGSIAASDAGGKMSDIVKKIIADVTDPDGVPRIHVVVATHRHKDHVSGFADGAWSAVEVGEVWMPWTEHPTDPLARKIREAQSKLALNLSTALAAAAPAAAGSASTKFEHAAATAMAENALALSNAAAMSTLHNGFIGVRERRFLPLKGATEESRRIESELLPGVRIHVLGPSRDPEVIRDMDPPKGESYLRLNGARTSAGGTPPAPFAAEYKQPQSYSIWSLPLEDAAEIQKASDNLSALAVAAALDKAVNGTSLMLILEVAGAVLLFPGDAQWGTWTAVLQDPEWQELLQRVNFYKIGHHGSHNATPKDFVRDLLPVGCCTMASTLVRTIWPGIPKQQLLTALLQKDAEIARSDQPDKATGQAFKVADGVIEARIPF